MQLVWFLCSKGSLGKKEKKVFRTDGQTYGKSTMSLLELLIALKKPKRLWHNSKLAYFWKVYQSFLSLSSFGWSPQLYLYFKGGIKSFIKLDTKKTITLHLLKYACLPVIRIYTNIFGLLWFIIHYKLLPI